MFDFALVSINLTAYSSARARPCSLVMTFLSSISHLLPTRILFTSSEACCSIFLIQLRMSKLEWCDCWMSARRWHRMWAGCPLRLCSMRLWLFWSAPGQRCPLSECAGTDLQLDALAIEVDCSDFEVDSDCCDEGRREGVVWEAQQQTALSDARVANEQQLDEVVVRRAFACGHWCCKNLFIYYSKLLFLMQYFHLSS